jgi:MFS family permease
MTVDSYLPLYVQLTRGGSVQFAAFSITFLTVGCTSGSFIFSRLLSHWRESAVILLGAALSVPSLVAAGLLVAAEQSLALILGTFVLLGLSIGLVSTASLTLMQASSDESEMGRVNAAHQFVRNLSFTLAVALGGAVILSVVETRVGDVETVRDVLAGAELLVGPETMDAVGDGLAWAHVPSVAIALGGLIVARSLIRRERA